MGLTDKLQMAAKSDPGMERLENEDRCFFDRELGLVIVADGIGGAKAGEVASSLAVTMIGDEVRKGAATHQSSQEGDGAACRQWLAGILTATNRTIHQVANSQPQYKGMGVALVMAFFRDNRVVVCHVGDSRLYRLRGETLEQITRDHTIFQELISRGQSEEEARAAVRRNILSKALGPLPEVEPTIQEHPVQTGDLFLLCSDGLTDMIDDQRIRQLLLEHQEQGLPPTVEALVQAANEAGGRDNVTVLLTRAVAPFPAQNKWYNRLFR